MRKRDAAAARDGDQRIVLGGVRILLHRLQVHAGQRADDFQMAEFLGADVHEQIFAGHVLAVDALDGVLHGRRQFAIGPAELLEEHVAEARIGRADAHGEHEFLDVMIHG